MRIFATFALTFTTLSAQAETGPPTAEELARAKTECAVDVQQGCLFPLAIDSLLQSLPAHRSGEESVFRLNLVARVQVRSGDESGALRTLGLTDPLPDTLLDLGLWDQAWAKAQASFAGNEPPVSETHEGNFKRRMVIAMLARGETTRALTTAMSIPETGNGERDKALQDIVTHTTAAGDLAAALDAVGLMQEGQSPFINDRAKALLTIVEAEVKAEAMADAEAMLDRIGHPASNLRARLVLAKGWHNAGFGAKAEEQFDLVLAGVPPELVTGSWMIQIIIDSADLALSLELTPTARKHALAAYDLIDGMEIGSMDELSQDHRRRLASVLDQVGASGKAAAIRSAGSKVSGDAPWTKPARLGQLIPLLKSQLEQQDHGAAKATLNELRTAVLAKPYVLGSDHLLEVVMSLLSAGLAVEAHAFVDQVAAVNPRYVDPVPAYGALVAADLSKAQDLLASIEDGRTRFSVSLTLAEKLVTHGRQTEARALLGALVAQMPPCGNESLATYQAMGGLHQDVIIAQDRLGFAEDAALSRRDCLSDVLTAGDGPKDAYLLLLNLAQSYP